LRLRRAVAPRQEATEAQRKPLHFGLRPRLLGALLLTAVVSLGAAAVTLLTPLKSHLRSDAFSVQEAFVGGAKVTFGHIPLDPGNTLNVRAIREQASRLYRQNNKLVRVVVWSPYPHPRRVADFPPDFPPERDAGASSALAQRAAASGGHRPQKAEIQGVGAVAESYFESGKLLVLEIFKPLDFVDQADDVVASAFLDAALAGLAVAFVLGIALSSRLLRRLRLLQTASRTLDERDLGTLVVPHERVSDEIGELARAFATMHERLRQQEDARRAFVANASHELRTPLTSLDGMLELLADDLVSDPIDIDDARERVAAAQLQSRRLRGLASDLLDLSRLDAAVELRSEAVELGETARAVAAEFDARARERHVSVTLDESGGQSWAQADPGSVARIVRILLDNALYVAPPDSTVAIQVGSNGAAVAISVSDEGPGVPQDEREMIFERFRRGQTRSDEGGFGLGLAIGSELAARMGGRLELTDGDGQRGATFRLALREVAD
jgi:signal transduction histidine kinase